MGRIASFLKRWNALHQLVKSRKFWARPLVGLWWKYQVNMKYFWKFLQCFSIRRECLCIQKRCPSNQRNTKSPTRLQTTSIGIQPIKSYILTNNQTISGFIYSCLGSIPRGASGLMVYTPFFSKGVSPYHFPINTQLRAKRRVSRHAFATIKFSNTQIPLMTAPKRNLMKKTFGWRYFFDLVI